MTLSRTPRANRGPLDYTTISTAVTFTPPIEWIHVLTAGSGGLVVKDEGGIPRTFAGLEAERIIPGPFTEITSMTCTKIRVGDGPLPVALPLSGSLASATTGAGADLVGYPDASSKTTAITTGAAVDELFVNATSAQAMVYVDLSSAILAAGTPMAAWADNAGASAPGITLANSKAVGLRWNNQGTQTAVWLSAVMPQDLNDAAALVLHALVSKSGATVGDATSLTVTAFFQTVGALHDADTDCGGTSSAVVGDATAKTVSELTLSIAHGDVPAAPCNLSFSVKPTDSTLGTDDFVIEAIWFEYTRKALTA
jgi:hypothetical protein